MTAPAVFSTPAPMALRCPKCAADMTTYERSGIVLDQCTECRGIYLDRGELDRIIDAEARHAMAAAPAPAPVAPHQAPYRPEAPYRPDAPYRQDDRYRGDDRYRDDRRAPGWDDRGFRPDWDDDDDDDRRRGPGWDDRGRPKKKRSLFGELLENFGD